MDQTVTFERFRTELLEIWTEPDARRWLELPNVLLGMRRPIDCQPDEVQRLLSQLLDSAYI